MVRFIKKVSAIVVFTFFAVVLWGGNSAYAADTSIDINPGGSFNPDTATINTGDTVIWTNTGTTGDNNAIAGDNHTKHVVYPDPVCDNKDDPNTIGCWDSKPHPMNGGATYSFTFMIGGTWTFHNHTSQPGQNEGTITVNDLNTPATTTNLSASTPTSSSIDLTWTSPGDDVGNTGNFLTPESYDVRYSTSTITDSNWASATQATGEPTPQSAGATETMTVFGLTASTTYYFALKTSDDGLPGSGTANVTALSNVGSATTLVAGAQPPPPPPSGGAIPVDSTAPSTIKDLAINGTNATSVELTWTAPGGDGSEGAASVYNMRYATEEITRLNWDFITKVIGEPVPRAAGSRESMTISGLSPETTYYFALNALDEASNESAFSNVVSTSTSAIPDIIAPSMIRDLELINQTPSSQEIIWTAPGDDENLGKATSYDIRFSSNTITDESWDSAFIPTNIPAPRIAGSRESMMFVNLEQALEYEATYYVAVKTTDKEGNESALSNVISFITLKAPEEKAITTTSKGEITATPTRGGEVTATTDEGATAKINIPSTAIYEDTIFTVTPIEKKSPDAAFAVETILPEKQIVGNYIFDYTAEVAGVATTTFAGDLNITFTYTDAQIAPFEESTLEILYYDEANLVWVPVSGTLYLNFNTITARVSHLTRFAIIASADVTPPDAPAEIRTTTLGEGKIKISWTNPIKDFSYIKLYRSEEIFELGKVHASKISDSEFTDSSNIIDGNTYYYTVRAVDPAGNESDNTEQSGAFALGSSEEIRLALEEGGLIRGPDRIKTYIVNGHGYKRHIFNPAVFNMYGHFSWENIKEVSQELLDSYKTSDLYRADEDDKVYSLEEVDEAAGIALKRHIDLTAEQFISRGYDRNQVFTVNSEERDYYTEGAPIT